VPVAVEMYYHNSNPAKKIFQTTFDNRPTRKTAARIIPAAVRSCNAPIK